MRLTPEILEATYRFLVTTPPFRGWKLLPSDEISWRVTRHRDRWGEYGNESGENHWISISEIKVGHNATLVWTIAHEMIHLRQALRKTETRNAEHNAEFVRLWQQVAKHHGWDPKTL